MYVPTGFRVEYVRDSDVAVAVMKQSDCKGYVLERVLSCPAWAPIISLERYVRTYVCAAHVLVVCTNSLYSTYVVCVLTDVYVPIYCA